MPKDIAKQVRSLMCNFLWGGKEGVRKLAWVKWDSLCKPKKDGGLGIRNLSCVNLVLLTKWVWRFVGEKERMWSRVIKSRHGELSCETEGFRLVRRGGSRGGWWATVVALAEGEKGKWFWEKLKLKLGDGKTANFWEGRWAGEQSIKQRFPRMFQLSKFRNGKVAEMGSWITGRWRWEVAWRRELLEREKGAAEELLSFLGNFTLVEGNEDRWHWGEKNGGEFLVKEAYRDISAGDGEDLGSADRTGDLRAVWKSDAPFKAQIMAWKLLLNRLPTIDNLSKFMEVTRGERKCRGCNSTLETAWHFFLRCGEAEGVWNKMVNWIGVKWAPPFLVVDHFRAFSDLLDGGKRRHSLRGLWICVVWVMWKWRNVVTFDGRPWDGKRIEVEIKCRFWGWSMVKGRAVNDCSFSCWSNKNLIETWGLL